MFAVVGTHVGVHARCKIVGVISIHVRLFAFFVVLKTIFVTEFISKVVSKIITMIFAFKFTHKTIEFSGKL